MKNLKYSWKRSTEQKKIKIHKRDIMEKELSKQNAQTLLLDLFIELQEQCRAAGVHYYAVAGTLLGSVRHDGFIPWDDDIDVVIMREDYDRLINHLEKNLAEGYCVVTRENSPCYFQEYPKLCYKNRQGVPSELAVDIFVYDATDKDKKLLRAFQDKSLYLLFALKRYKVQKMNGINLSISNKAERAVIGAVAGVTSFKTIDKAFNKVVRLSGKNNKEYITNWGSHYHYEKSTYKRSVFGTPRQLMFEGIEMDVPAEYETFLLQTYGKNYMQLPPEEKRISHGNSSVGCEDVDIKKAEERVARRRAECGRN